MKVLLYFAALIDKSEVKIPQPGANTAQIQSFLQIVLTIAGAVAILMVVIGGFQYVISSGDPQKTARAKDTILYALVGLAVAVFAQAIVTFVLGKIFK